MPNFRKFFCINKNKYKTDSNFGEVGSGPYITKKTLKALEQRFPSLKRVMKLVFSKCPWLCMANQKKKLEKNKTKTWSYINLIIDFSNQLTGT